MPSILPLDSQLRSTFGERLLTWFACHARDLPWRQGRTPYRAWVAEVMLQQTRAETMVPYYGRFLARFPTVQALANATLEEVLKVWEGLGYYARARHLHAAAREIVASHGGELPHAFEEWLALPGVGRYVAGALASIACGQDVVAVDGNARRVLCRAFGIQEDVARPATQRRLESLAASLLLPGRAGAFNEALMELGATVCTPRAPGCHRCPWCDLCVAYAQGDPEALPVRSPRRRVPHYDVAAAVIVQATAADAGAAHASGACPEGARVLVAQRKADDMLGGLWEFPGGKREEGEALAECLVREIREELGVEIEVGERLTIVRHAYTHFRITLHAFRCRLVAGDPRCLDCAAFRWVAIGELEELPMSVADRKIAQALTLAKASVTFARVTGLCQEVSKCAES